MKDLVYYNLCSTEEEGFIVYGVELVSTCEEKSYLGRISLNRLSCSKQLVLDILHYLYENSIKPDSAQYIVEDILNLKKLPDENVLVIN